MWKNYHHPSGNSEQHDGDPNSLDQELQIQRKRRDLHYNRKEQDLHHQWQRENLQHHWKQRRDLKHHRKRQDFHHQHRKDSQYRWQRPDTNHWQTKEDLQHQRKRQSLFHQQKGQELKTQRKRKYQRIIHLQDEHQNIDQQKRHHRRKRSLHLMQVVPIDDTIQKRIERELRGLGGAGNLYLHGYNYVDQSKFVDTNNEGMQGYADRIPEGANTSDERMKKSSDKDDFPKSAVGEFDVRNMVATLENIKPEESNVDFVDPDEDTPDGDNDVSSLVESPEVNINPQVEKVDKFHGQAAKRVKSAADVGNNIGTLDETSDEFVDVSDLPKAPVDNDISSIIDGPKEYVKVGSGKDDTVVNSFVDYGQDADDIGTLTDDKSNNDIGTVINVANIKKSSKGGEDIGGLLKTRGQYVKDGMDVNELVPKPTEDVQSSGDDNDNGEDDGSDDGLGVPNSNQLAKELGEGKLTHHHFKKSRHRKHKYLQRPVPVAALENVVNMFKDISKSTKENLSPTSNKKSNPRHPAEKGKRHHKSKTNKHKESSLRRKAKTKNIGKTLSNIKSKKKTRENKHHLKGVSKANSKLKKKIAKLKDKLALGEETSQRQILEKTLKRKLAHEKKLKAKISLEKNLEKQLAHMVKNIQKLQSNTEYKADPTVKKKLSPELTKIKPSEKARVPHGESTTNSNAQSNANLNTDTNIYSNYNPNVKSNATSNVQSNAKSNLNANLNVNSKVNSDVDANSNGKSNANENANLKVNDNESIKRQYNLEHLLQSLKNNNVSKHRDPISQAILEEDLDYLLHHGTPLKHQINGDPLDKQLEKLLKEKEKKERRQKALLHQIYDVPRQRPFSLSEYQKEMMLLGKVTTVSPNRESFASIPTSNDKKPMSKSDKVLLQKLLKKLLHTKQKHTKSKTTVNDIKIAYPKESDSVPQPDLDVPYNIVADPQEILEDTGDLSQSQIAGSANAPQAPMKMPGVMPELGPMLAPSPVQMPLQTVVGIPPAQPLPQAPLPLPAPLPPPVQEPFPVAAPVPAVAPVPPPIQVPVPAPASAQVPAAPPPAPAPAPANVPAPGTISTPVVSAPAAPPAAPKYINKPKDPSNTGYRHKKQANWKRQQPKAQPSQKLQNLQAMMRANMEQNAKMQTQILQHAVQLGAQEQAEKSKQRAKQQRKKKKKEKSQNRRPVPVNPHLTVRPMQPAQVQHRPLPQQQGRNNQVVHKLVHLPPQRPNQLVVPRQIGPSPQQIGPQQPIGQQQPVLGSQQQRLGPLQQPHGPFQQIHGPLQQLPSHQQPVPQPQPPVPQPPQQHYAHIAAPPAQVLPQAPAVSMVPAPAPAPVVPGVPVVPASPTGPGVPAPAPVPAAVPSVPGASPPAPATPIPAPGQPPPAVPPAAGSPAQAQPAAPEAKGPPGSAGAQETKAPEASKTTTKPSVGSGKGLKKKPKSSEDAKKEAAAKRKLMLQIFVVITIILIGITVASIGATARVRKRIAEKK